MTFARTDDLPETLPRRGAFFSPVCIEFGPLVYAAVIRAETEEITTIDDGSIRVVGRRPQVVEDGVLERSALRIADLNERAAKLGRVESSKDCFSIPTTLADDEKVEADGRESMFGAGLVLPSA